MKYKRLYIAYGSNINLQQMAHRCPDSRVIGKAMLRNMELEFRGVATIVPKQNAQTPVLLWEIWQADEISLDRYEGFPHMYRKELFELEIGGKTRECMAYVMNYGEISPPSTSYYNGILKGYTDNKMDTKYLDAALRRSIEVQETMEAEHIDEPDYDDDLDDDELDDLFDDLQITFE